MNLYGFVWNDPLGLFDPDGRAIGDSESWPPLWMRLLHAVVFGERKKLCCGGKPYDKGTHCCCVDGVVKEGSGDKNAKPVEKKRRASGIVLEEWQARLMGGIQHHVWTKWPDHSADANAKIPDKIVRMPAGGARWMPQGGIHRPPFNYMLSPCEYDFKAVFKCMTEFAQQWVGKKYDRPPISPCVAFQNDLIIGCLDKHKGCTMPEK